MKTHLVLVISLGLLGGGAYAADSAAGDSSVKPLEGKIEIGEGVCAEATILGYRALKQCARVIARQIRSHTKDGRKIALFQDEIVNGRDIAQYNGILSCLDAIATTMEDETAHYQKDKPTKAEIAAAIAGLEKSHSAHPTPNHLPMLALPVITPPVAIGSLPALEPWFKLLSYFKSDTLFKNAPVARDSQALMALVGKALTESADACEVTIPTVSIEKNDSILQSRFLRYELPIVDGGSAKGQAGAYHAAKQALEEATKQIEAIDTAMDQQKTRASSAALEHAKGVRDRIAAAVKASRVAVANYDGLKTEIMSKDMTALWQIDSFMGCIPSEARILIVKTAAMAGTNRGWRPFLGKSRYRSAGAAVAQYLLLDRKGKLIDSDVIPLYTGFATIQATDLND